MKTFTGLLLLSLTGCGISSPIRVVKYEDIKELHQTYEQLLEKVEHLQCEHNELFQRLMLAESMLKLETESVATLFSRNIDIFSRLIELEQWRNDMDPQTLSELQQEGLRRLRRKRKDN